MNRMQIFAGITVLATSAVLFSGCSGESQTASTENTGSEQSATSTENTGSEQSATSTENKDCEHLIVNFGNQTVIFRECEGYRINCSASKSGGTANYSIISDGEYLMSGYTSEYNRYVSNHEQVEEIEQEAIENGAYVFKLQK